MLLARELTERAIGLAIEVHRLTGPGMLESVYEGCLRHELEQAGVAFERQAGIQVAYKGVQFDEARPAHARPVREPRRLSPQTLRAKLSPQNQRRRVLVLPVIDSAIDP